MAQRKIKEQEEKKHNKVENSSNISLIHSHSDITLQNTHFNTFMNPTFNPTLSKH